VIFRIFRAYAVVLGVGLAFGGCGGGTKQPPSMACVPGRSIACNGAQGCPGHQVCRDDGAAFDVCVCAGDETFPAAGPASGLLGAACEDDSDCRKGFSCLTSTSTGIQGEGPSAGLCVLECARDASVCEKADASSNCIVLDDRGTTSGVDDAAFCLPRCALGDPTTDDDKCRGRIDLVCSEDTAGTGLGYCRPACRGDIDCGKRHCDLRTGLCGDDAPSGAAIGSACDPAMPSCAGGCIDHGASYAECSGVCRFGTPGCGQDPSVGKPYDFYCYLDPSGRGGEGDLGYCTRVCDCNDDCARDDAVCEPHASLMSDTGRAGVCASKLFASGGARPSLPCK